MNIFKFETKAHLKSTVIWTVSLVLIAALFISLLPGFLESKDDFLKMLSSYPKEFLAALGFSTDDFSILSFYAYIFNFVVLAAAIQGCNLGLGIISKEGRNKTMDFLLTKPKSRIEILFSKVMAGMTLLIFTSIVFNFVSVILMNVVATESYSIKTFILMNLVIFYIQIIFFVIGIFVSIVSKKIKSVIGISMAITMGLFLVNMLEKILKWDFLRLLTPFQYFDTSYIAINGNYEISFMIFSLILIIVITAISFIVYKRKDVHAV